MATRHPPEIREEPKKISGSSTNLVNTGEGASRSCEDISFDSEVLTKREKQSNTFDNCGSTKTLKSGNYNYWIAASCNHLDEAASDEEEADGNDIFVTCLGKDKDYVILAFAQSNPSYSQNACAIYKFKVESSGFAKIRKTSSRQDVLSHSGYSLAGAVYYLYTDKACTQRAKDTAGNHIVLTTKANGETNVVEVEPNVTYYAKEIAPSPGFELDTNVNDGKGIKVTTANDEDHPAAFSSTETPLRSHVRLIKKAEKTETDFLSEAPNNYRLAGAVYKFYSDASCTKQANDFNNKPAELTTDAKGETRIMEMLPGTYYVKETTAPGGFCIDGGKDTPKVYKITLTLGHDKTHPYEVSSTEAPAYAPFTVILDKQNEEYGYMRLLGAEYTLCYYDTKPDTKDVSGLDPVKTWVFKVVEGGKDKTGRKTAQIDFVNDEPISGGSMYKENGIPVMPVGVFTLKETKAPRGLAIDPATYIGNVSQPSNGAAAKAAIEGGEKLYVDYTGRFELLNAEPKRSVKIELQKKSASTGESRPEGQESDTRRSTFGSLAGATYEVYMDDPALLNDPKVGEIVTDENGHGELTTDSHNNGQPLNPGTYYIKETIASPGYVIDAMANADKRNVYENGRHIIHARVDDESDTVVFNFTAESLEPEHHTYVSKTDLTTGKELPGAHLQVLNSKGEIVEEWTSSDEPHDIVALHDETQGLKDGRYILREITAPYGYDVAEDVEFEVSSKAVVNTVKMKNMPVTIGTTATDSETGSHAGRYTTDETIKDAVRVTGLYEGRKYRISGMLMDKATGEPVKDAAGEAITAEKDFTANADVMTIDLDFPVDSSQFNKETTTVAFEKLYRIEKVCDEEADSIPLELQKHEDINDEGQSIHYGGIASTTALDKKSGSHNVLAGDHAVVIDTVRYRNLSTEEEYTLEGEFFDKTTGKMTGIKGFAKFRPQKPDGTVEVKFAFDAGALEGHTLVAYETLSVIAKIDGEKQPFEIDRHEDPEDEAQTMHIPAIRTTASDAETGEHMTLASKDVQIRDLVTYSNLIPGKEYEMTGTLMDKETGKPVKDNGKVVTASERFTPDKADGTVEIVFTFNGAKMAGKKVVAFEKCTVLGVPVAVHADIEDKDQTVKLPKIGTKAALIDKKVTDTVTYEDLDAASGYVLKGWLMNTKNGKKESGSDGKKYFTIRENDNTSGEINVELPVENYEKIRGEKVTAFEELYVLRANDDGNIEEILISEHKDLKDNGQTVRIPDRSVPPKTGDNTMLWLYGVLLAGAFTAMMSLVFKETIRSRRQRKEDREMFA